MCRKTCVVNVFSCVVNVFFARSTCSLSKGSKLVDFGCLRYESVFLFEHANAKLEAVLRAHTRKPILKVWVLPTKCSPIERSCGVETEYVLEKYGRRRQCLGKYTKKTFLFGLCQITRLWGDKKVCEHSVLNRKD